MQGCRSRTSPSSLVLAHLASHQNHPAVAVAWQASQQTAAVPSCAASAGGAACCPCPLPHLNHSLEAAAAGGAAVCVAAKKGWCCWRSYQGLPKPQWLNPAQGSTAASRAVGAALQTAAAAAAGGVAWVKADLFGPSCCWPHTAQVLNPAGPFAHLQATVECGRAGDKLVST